MAIAEAAYKKYVERLGRPPAPMYEDYGEAVQRGTLHVLVADGTTVGLLEVKVADDHVYIENAAITPTYQKRGLGVHFLMHAEAQARAAGVSELRLHTNVRMTENIALYQAAGFTVFDQREEDGFERVYMRKPVWDEDRFLAVLDTHHRSAMLALFEHIQACGLDIEWSFSGAEISFRHGDMPLPVGWAIPPGTVGWLYVTDLTLGYEEAIAQSAPSLTGALEAYVERLLRVEGGTRPARPEFNGATFAPSSVIGATTAFFDAFTQLAR